MTLNHKTLSNITKATAKSLDKGYEVYAEATSADANETRMLDSAYGTGVVYNILKQVKSTPLTKDPVKQLKESCKILEKQLKLLTTDETINKNEYTYKLAYSTIQGVNQALHLYVITAEEVDYELVQVAYEFLRSIDNVYEIAEQLKKFASAKQNWAGR